MGKHRDPRTLEFISRIENQGKNLGFIASKEYPLLGNEFYADLVWKIKDLPPLASFEVETRATGSLFKNMAKYFGTPSQEVAKPWFHFVIVLDGRLSKGSKLAMHNLVNQHNILLFENVLRDEKEKNRLDATLERVFAAFKAPDAPHPKRLTHREVAEEDMPYLGRLRYHEVVKEIEIVNEKGDANIKLEQDGESRGNSLLNCVFHTMNYDSAGFLEDEVEGRINGINTAVRVESQARIGKHGGPRRYESRFYFSFPKPVPPKSPLPRCSFTVFIPQCYGKAFETWDSTTHKIDVSTGRLILRLATMYPIAISDWQFYVEDFHQYVDDAELRRVINKFAPKNQNGTLIWKIDKPKLNDRYVLRFRLREGSEKPEGAHQSSAHQKDVTHAILTKEIEYRAHL